MLRADKKRPFDAISKITMITNRAMYMPYSRMFWLNIFFIFWPKDVVWVTDVILSLLD
jgi:hypothetical protein